MESTVFWDVTPYSPVEVHRSFGRMYCLHLQVRRESQSKNQFCLSLYFARFLRDLLFDPEPGGITFFRYFGGLLRDHTAYIPEECILFSNGLFEHKSFIRTTVSYNAANIAYSKN
jgi:hypothetical protein